MSDDDDQPLDLSAWEPQSPPSDFAERVMAVVHPPKRRRRWPYVAACSSMAVAAAVLLGIGSSPASKGEAIAKDRIEVPLGRRALAVLEPGANVRWNGDDVVQSTGDVFYRVEPGARFTVHTPAGDIEVKGTCFSVKVREMNKRDLKVGATSAALSALAFVAVYEGKVAVSHAADRMELTAGQTAQSSESGVKRSSGDSDRDIDLAIATAENGGDEDPQVAANKNLVRQISDYRHRLDAVASEKSELETKLKKSEAALSSAKDGSPVKLKDDFDLEPSEWKELAKDGTIKFRAPCIDGKGKGWTPSPEKLDKLGLAPHDGPVLTEAYKQSSARLWSVIKPLCASAVGSADVASKIGPDTCVHLVLDTEMEKDPGGADAARKLVGSMRAGDVPMPAAGTSEYEKLNPVTKMFIALTGSSKALEDDLSKDFGAEEAHRLAYADGMCAWQSTFGGSPAKK